VSPGPGASRRVEPTGIPDAVDEHLDLDVVDPAPHASERRSATDNGPAARRGTGFCHMAREVQGTHTCFVGDNTLTKLAGVQWVCSVLARLGWVAAPTGDGVDTDILAVHADDERRIVEIQVKTAKFRGSHTNWLLDSKAKRLSVSDREWLVLVLLPTFALQAPRGFVVPRDHAAAAAYIHQQDWLTEHGIPTGTRNTPLTQSRTELAVWTGYENRWDLLLKPTSNAPVLLPPDFRDLALDERVGLPPGHPWLRRLPNW
jgi:hypothetical protein